LTCRRFTDKRGGLKPKIEPLAENALDAPGVLKQLQEDAWEARERKAAALARVFELQQMPENGIEVDKVAMARAENDLATAKDDWLKISKALLTYDRGVSSERKEGERVAVSEAREIFAQLILSITLAVEQVIIADAQSAALCDSPEAFYSAAADNYRAALDNALAAAKRDGVLPAWVTTT